MWIPSRAVGQDCPRGRTGRHGGRFLQRTARALSGAETRLRTENLVADLASEYEADAKWNDHFRGRFGVYTFELQQALIRPDQQPVVIRARLLDVVATDVAGVFIVLAETSWDPDFLGVFGGPLYLRLECKGDAIQDVLDSPESHEPGLFRGGPEYAFVARIQELTNPLETSDNRHFTSATALVASGECLAGTWLRD